MKSNQSRLKTLTIFLYLVNRNGMPKSTGAKKPTSYVPKNVANPPGHSNIVREIEEKAALYGKTDDDEPSAPFNFQVIHLNNCQCMKNRGTLAAAYRDILNMLLAGRYVAWVIVITYPVKFWVKIIIISWDLLILLVLLISCAVIEANWKRLNLSSILEFAVELRYFSVQVSFLRFRNQ